MPGIWNVNSGYNINTKKVSSKLTFESGERFTGRVISKGDGKDVTIKLADGWQFVAELEGNVDLSDIKLVKFQVDGFEGGKLKLKLVNENTEDTVVEDENLKDLIQKEGLSKEDINVLKKMITHNISLTRENINEIKGLIKFNEKISANPKEIDAFIEKYLQSKGISSDSSDGQVIKQLLNKFLGEFKKISAEDILTFVENNLDFSEENISSFNNLFKGDSSIEDLLKKIDDSIKQLDIPKNNSSNNAENKITEQLINKPIENAKNAMDNINSALATKIYNENDLTNNQINILDVLKTLTANNESVTESVQESKFDESQLSKSLIEKLNDKELVQLIKDTIGDGLSNREVPKTQTASLIESINKIKVEELLSKSEGKEVKLTTNEFREFIDLINKTEVDEISKKSLVIEKSNIEPKTEEIGNENTRVIKESASNTQLNNFFEKSLDYKEIVKSEMKNNIDNLKDVVKNLFTQIKLNEFLSEFEELSTENIFKFVKNNLNFSEENINSLNNLFKEDPSIEEILKKISDSIKETSISKGDLLSNNQNKVTEQLINNTSESVKDKMDNINSMLATKIYNENDLTNKKINILDVLKTLAANNENVTESVQESKFDESQLSKSLIEKLNDKELVQSIKDTIGDVLSNREVPKTQAASLIESTNKIKVEELLSKSEGKEVKLTTNEFREFIDLINKTEVDEISKKSLASEKSNIEHKPLTSTGTDENIQVIKESVSKTQLNGLFGESLDSKELIKSEIKNKIENVRDIVKDLINQTESKEAGYEKVMNLIKSNINDIKVFNSISNEYYYLNFPVTLQNIEYPCQLIIKDNRKDGKKIDSTNAKMVVIVKTTKLGEVDGYLTMKENRIDVKLKCDDEFTYALNNNKSKLVDGLSTLGLYVSVSVESKDKPANIVNCRNFFNDISISAIDTKV